ncbi:MAG: YcxB family protein [Clostridia bacterium]|nr:YcxB family protein [Clostridia bacterium]
MKERENVELDKPGGTAGLDLEEMKTSEEEIEKSLAEEDGSPEGKEEKEEDSNWDGSEAEFVEDDDALEYEEQNAGIKINYALTRDEIFNCIKHCGINKNIKILGEITLGMMTMVAFVLFFKTYKKGFLIFFSLFLALFFLWAFDVLHLFLKKLRYKKISPEKKLSVEIFPNEISVETDTRKIDIPLDGTNFFEEFKNMFLIYLPKQRVFIIPTRAIEPEFLPDVQAMLIAGTKPISENSNDE